MKNKIFKIDNTGKSKAFFLKKGIFLKQRYILDLKKKTLNSKKDNRICMHLNKRSSLHIMINCLIKKKEYSPHKHINKDEFYYILDGKLKIIFVDTKNKELKNFIVTKKNNFFYLNRNIIHYTIPLTKTCVFIEARPGPFKISDTVKYNLLRKDK